MIRTHKPGRTDCPLCKVLPPVRQKKRRPWTTLERKTFLLQSHKAMISPRTGVNGMRNRWPVNLWDDMPDQFLGAPEMHQTPFPYPFPKRVPIEELLPDDHTLMPVSRTQLGAATMFYQTPFPERYEIRDGEYQRLERQHRHERQHRQAIQATMNGRRPWTAAELRESGINPVFSVPGPTLTAEMLEQIHRELIGSGPIAIP